MTQEESAMARTRDRMLQEAIRKADHYQAAYTVLGQCSAALLRRHRRLLIFFGVEVLALWCWIVWRIWT